MDLLDDDGLLNLRRSRATDPKALIEELQARRTATPAINPDLAAWAADEPQEARQAIVVGEICHLCDHARRLVCASCNEPVCAAHAWVMLGLCHSCASNAPGRMAQEG